MYYIDRRWSEGAPWGRLFAYDTLAKALDVLPLLMYAHGGFARIVTAHGEVVHVAG